MTHACSIKKNLLTRVRRIKGQAASLEKSMEAGEECLKILQQVAAVRGAINGLMNELLETHIREHLMNEETTSEKRADDLQEIVTVIRSYLK